MGKWLGLGMGMFTNATYPDRFNTAVDTLLSLGITELRIDIPTYTATTPTVYSKTSVLSAISKGANVVWGISSGTTTITNTTWPDFHDAILVNAQWAQDNGVWEFQIGNEEEYHVDGTTMTVAQLITNLKSTATEVQAIFTRGNVSYSCFHNNISDWISAGKGTDIDLLASNVYMEWGDHNTIDWKGEIDSLVSAFGPNGTYLTEFSVNTSSLDSYATSESVQVSGIKKMLDYINTSGMTRAYFFCYNNALFGVLSVAFTGTYRKLWYTLLGQRAPVTRTKVTRTTVSRNIVVRQ